MSGDENSRALHSKFLLKSGNHAETHNWPCLPFGSKCNLHCLRFTDEIILGSGNKRTSEVFVCLVRGMARNAVTVPNQAAASVEENNAGHWGTHFIRKAELML